MRVRLTLPALLVAALLGVAACGGGSDAARPAAAGETASPTPGASASAGTEASPTAGADKPATVPEKLTFKGRTLDGKDFDGASLAGRPVVLWFWAPWCATCISEAWSVSDLAPKYAGKVAFVGVAGMGSEKDMREFVSDGKVGGVTHLADGPGTLWKRFDVKEQSTFVLLDRTGKVLHSGFLDSVEFTNRVAALAA